MGREKNSLPALWCFSLRTKLILKRPAWSMSLVRTAHEKSWGSAVCSVCKGWLHFCFLPPQISALLPKYFLIFYILSNNVLTVYLQGSQDSLVEHRTHDQKVVSSNISTGSGRIFFSGVNFEHWLLLSVCSTPVLLQLHAKDPSHSAKAQVAGDT